MKKNCLMLIILTCITLLSCSGESEDERMLFKKIKPGMKVNEVIEILGKPDTILSSLDSTAEYIFFSKSKSGLRSQMPVVIFDSSMRVTSSTYGE